MLGGIVKAEGLGDGFLPMRASYRQASLDDATQSVLKRIVFCPYGAPPTGGREHRN